MKKNHLKTLQAIFRQPTSGTIIFAEIESLIAALGGEVQEREGSRVKITLRGILMSLQATIFLRQIISF